MLRELAARGLKLGLISNSHRSPGVVSSSTSSCDGLIAAALSSSEHGYLKPHPSIFEAALRLAGVERERVGDGGRQPARTISKARARRDARRAGRIAAELTADARCQLRMLRRLPGLFGRLCQLKLLVAASLI